MAAVQRALVLGGPNKAANGVNGKANGGGGAGSPGDLAAAASPLHHVGAGAAGRNGGVSYDDESVASPRRAHTLPARAPRQLAVGKKYGDDRGLPGARQEYGDSADYRPDQPLLAMHDLRSGGADDDAGGGRLVGTPTGLDGRHPGEGQEAEEPRYGTRVAFKHHTQHAIAPNACIGATNRSQDSGIPEEGTDSGTSLSPPAGLLKPCPMGMTSNASEAGSSGIHSDGSSSTGGDHHPHHHHQPQHPHQQQQQQQQQIYSKRAISVEHLITGQPGSPAGNQPSLQQQQQLQHLQQQQQWKSSSLQRPCDQQQTVILANQHQIIAERSAGGHVMGRDPIYVSHQETIAIRRTQPSGSSPPAQYRDDENPYMRATNIRLTSFTEGQAGDHHHQQQQQQQQGGYQKQTSHPGVVSQHHQLQHESSRHSLPLDTSENMNAMNDLGHSPTPSPPLPPPPPPLLSQELPEAMAAYRQASSQAYHHQQQIVAARAAAAAVAAASESPYGHLRHGGDGAQHSPTYVSRATIYPPVIASSAPTASTSSASASASSSAAAAAAAIQAEMLAGTRAADAMESPYVARPPSSSRPSGGKSVTYNLPPKEITYESVYGRTPPTVAAASAGVRQVRPSNVGPYPSSGAAGTPTPHLQHQQHDGGLTRTVASHPHAVVSAPQQQHQHGGVTYMGQNFNGPLRPALKNSQQTRFQ